MNSLLAPYPLGDLTLRNRVVMAPMTRARAVSHHPDHRTVEYYQQRSSAGLIVTEGLPISARARGQVFTPGIYTAQDIDGWMHVTDAVHAEGGTIFAQLWHVGRCSHTSLQPDGKPPVSPVATPCGGNSTVFGFDENGTPARIPPSPPRMLSTKEVEQVISEFAVAAKNARVAGFDGIELHGANGYIFEQFINGALNDRDDCYGGAPIKNRLRFTLETVHAVANEVGYKRTGIRLSPFGRYNDLQAFEGEEETWLALAAALAPLGLAYVHIFDQAASGGLPFPVGFLERFREAFGGTLILAGGFNQATASKCLASRSADLVAFGRAWISNPDLVERFKYNWPLTEPDVTTFYSQGDEGYTTYLPYSDLPHQSHRPA